MSYQSPLSFEPSMIDMAPVYSSKRHPNQNSTRDPSQSQSHNQAQSHIDPQSYTFPQQNHNYNPSTLTQDNASSMLPLAHGQTPGSGPTQYPSAAGPTSGSAALEYTLGPTLGPTLGSDAYPPPASLATVNSDAIDLNDEIFFTYHAEPAYTTTASEPFALTHDVGVSSSSSSTANFDYAYPVHVSHDAGASPLKHFDAFDGHYSHTRRFSSAVEQLNRMSLRAPSSSKSPSPELYNVSQDHPEERTVNPQHLFGVGVGENRVDISPHFSTITVAAETGPQPATTSAPSRYILPSSVSSPSLSTLFNRSSAIVELDEPPGNHALAANNIDLDLGQVLPESLQASVHSGQLAHGTQSPKALQNPLNPYVMNDECVSAITYWLNNTADVISEKPIAGVTRNPTGVMKPGWARRNSIQVVSPRTEDAPSKAVRTLSMDQKRRRRKSMNSSSVPSVSLPANFSLNFTSSASASAQSQTQKTKVKTADPQVLSQGSEGHMSQKSLQSQAQTQVQNLQQLSDLGNIEDVLAVPTSGNAPVPIRTPTLLSSSKMPDKSNTTDVIFKGGFDTMDLSEPDPTVANILGKGNASGKQRTLSDPELLKVNSSDFASSNLELQVGVEALNTAPVQGNAGAGAGAGNDDDEPKPFPCPDCEKQFKRSEHLKRHIRSVHSNIRPFHCKYCEKKFSRSDNLAQHSKTHFKVNANGTTSVIYGNPNPQSRGGRKKSSGDVDMEAPVFES